MTYNIQRMLTHLIAYLNQGNQYYQKCNNTHANIKQHYYLKANHMYVYKEHVYKYYIYYIKL